MRSLEKNLKDLTLDGIAKFVSQERDVAYLVAKEEEHAKFVSYLLNERDHAEDQIADIAGVSVKFV